MPHADFYTAAHARTEAEVAEVLAERWRARPYHYGKYAPLDWYFVRGEDVVAVAELKCRNIRWGDYPSIYLSYQKFLHLMFAYTYSQLAALYVIRSVDRLMYIPVEDIPAEPVQIRGRPPRPGAVHDQEPMLQISTSLFRPV